MSLQIRPYRPADEQGWLRCRVLAFLDSAYYDNVLRVKEHYANPSIELVAEQDGLIVGLIDVELEEVPERVCSARPGLGGMIWHVAVHPDYRRHGVAHALLQEASRQALERGIARLEAWTRDDPWVVQWYERQGFTLCESYLHVFLDGGEEMQGVIRCEVPKLYPVQAFAHYVGEHPEEIIARFTRVHRCSLFELRID